MNLIILMFCDTFLKLRSGQNFPTKWVVKVIKPITNRDSEEWP